MIALTILLVKKTACFGGNWLRGWWLETSGRAGGCGFGESSRAVSPGQQLLPVGSSGLAPSPCAPWADGNVRTTGNARVLLVPGVLSGPGDCGSVPPPGGWRTFCPPGNLGLNESISKDSKSSPPEHKPQTPQSVSAGFPINTHSATGVGWEPQWVCVA